MTDRWTDRLSDYLDDELAPADRREVEAHLAGCACCAGVLEELKSVVGHARALPERDRERAPEVDLWPGVEARLAKQPVRLLAGWEAARWVGRRFSVSIPQVAAAAAAAVVVCGSAAWLAHDWGGREASARRGGPGGVAAVTASSVPGEAAQAEIESLRRLLAARRDRFDRETFVAIGRSLKAVESAVKDARLAVDADPDDPYLRAHLRELTDRHLELLRRAVDLAGGAE